MFSDYLVHLSTILYNMISQEQVFELLLNLYGIINIASRWTFAYILDSIWPKSQSQQGEMSRVVFVSTLLSYMNIVKLVKDYSWFMFLFYPSNHLAINPAMWYVKTEWLNNCRIYMPLSLKPTDKLIQFNSHDYIKVECLKCFSLTASYLFILRKTN